jgi:CHAD domain-containing protein
VLTAADLPEPVVVSPADPPVQHVRAALDLRLRALVGHAPGTRSGADVEDLHQMRVAVRRMRAALKAAGPLLDAGWADDVRAELGWLGGSLGPVRDLDVLLERLRGEVADLPTAEQIAGSVLVDALVEERERARATMLAALDDPRYAALVDRLADAVSRPLPTRSGGGDQPTLLELVRGQARSLRKGVQRAGEDPPDEVLHALRIRGKRVRYTGELVAPGLRGTPAGRVVKRLLDSTEGLQEVLGDHQDACVADERIRALVADRPDPAVAFVAGRLVEREHHKALLVRGRWWAAWERVAAQVDQLDGLG